MHRVSAGVLGLPFVVVTGASQLAFQFPLCFLFLLGRERTSVSQDETNQSSYLSYVQRPNRSQTITIPPTNGQIRVAWFEILMVQVRRDVIECLHHGIRIIHQIMAGQRRKKNFHLPSIVPLATVGVQIATKANKRKKLWHRQHSQPVFRS